MNVGKKVLGKRLFAAVMKPTFYGQFVAGENAKTIAPVIDRMRCFGVKSILDYSAEEDISQEAAEDIEMDSCISHAASDDLEPNFAGLNTTNRDGAFKSKFQKTNLRFPSHSSSINFSIYSISASQVPDGKV